MNDNFLILVKSIVASVGLKPIQVTTYTGTAAQKCLDELMSFVPEKDRKEYEIFYPYLQRIVLYIFHDMRIINCIVKHLTKFQKGE